MVAGCAFFARYRIARDSPILTVAVVFLPAVASVYLYLMGVHGVPSPHDRISGRG